MIELAKLHKCLHNYFKSEDRTQVLKILNLKSNTHPVNINKPVVSCVLFTKKSFDSVRMRSDLFIKILFS